MKENLTETVSVKTNFSFYMEMPRTESKLVIITELSSKQNK